MTPEGWHRIEDLYNAAQQRAPAERAALLEKADPDIRLCVEQMLGVHSGESILDQPGTQIPGETSITTVFAEGAKLGPYRIDGPISAGGMGIVYRATDTRLGRAVAIKITQAQYGDRFEREARLISTLSHPNICTLHDVGPNYLVMELLEGSTLAEEVRRGPLPPGRVARFGAQIAGALAEAHIHGIVHRDLKPANVMLTRHGLKVLDFGIARKLGEAPLTEANMIVGTPVYMAPEQMAGHEADARTDLFALGLVLYEMAVGKLPFPGASLGQMLASGSRVSVPPPSRERAAIPSNLDWIVTKLLQKDPAQRPQSALEVAGELTALADRLDAPARRSLLRPAYVVPVVLLLVLLIGGGAWLYRRAQHRIWARQEAVPEISRLMEAGKPLAAFLALQKAERYLPGDPQLAKIAKNAARFVSIRSAPSGAKVEIQDYSSPDSGWFALGTTPLQRIRIPSGFLRWRLSKPGAADFVAAPVISDNMQFTFGPALDAPPGMVPVPGGSYGNMIGFIGWVNYQLPPYDIDKFEVTNRQYQAFVDAGGYQKRQYWKQRFVKDGKELSWDEAMDLFRDPTGRSGPSTWAGGHFPPGRTDYPVSGVSWYEAAACAEYMGHSLPAIGQWYRAAPDEDVIRFVVNQSNFGGHGLLPAEPTASVGPYGTYDMTGNVREWALNTVYGDQRFILGGAWNTQTYQAFDPEALPPFDRSPANGFRTVRNRAPLPAATAGPVTGLARDFAKAKPASDAVFAVYKAMYGYDASRPLSPETQGIIENTADWTKEKIVIDAGYADQRFPVFLFLPKNVHPPYQAVVFFPSARANLVPSSDNLGDMDFIDYVIQSGRALIYPIYLGTYERAKEAETWPGTVGSLDWLIRQSKEVRRAVDYLETRPEIDKDKLAYVGVSQGSADGLIFTALEDRFRAVVFLDGGFFLGPAAAGADQVDFAPRLRRPALMMNGRYDFTFPPDRAQIPMFRMIGTPEPDKRQVILDTPHNIALRKPELSREVLGWLDKYLGKVN
ncbi:MAG: bifunctional serine/threonine-protein kinase/formylglycine-generating enzyme family protein [Bryobacteraceae bacterium]